MVANSTGWYTALAASGALGFDDAFRLVQEMAAAAEAPLQGDSAPAELIYPLTDEAWQPAEARIEGLSDALGEANGGTAVAIDLGPFAVIAGTSDGIDSLAGRLPPVQIADRDYPLRLASADAWHTPLRAAAAEEAASRLGRPALGSAERDPHRRARSPVHALVDRSGRAGRALAARAGRRPRTTSPPACGSRSANTRPTSCSFRGPAARWGRPARRLPWPRDTGACAAGPSSRPPRPARPRSSSRCAGDRARARPARPARPPGHARAAGPRSRRPHDPSRVAARHGSPSARRTDRPRSACGTASPMRLDATAWGPGADACPRRMHRSSSARRIGPRRSPPSIRSSAAFSARTRGCACRRPAGSSTPCCHRSSSRR